MHVTWLCEIIPNGIIPQVLESVDIVSVILLDCPFKSGNNIPLLLKIRL